MKFIRCNTLTLIIISTINLINLINNILQIYWNISSNLIKYKSDYMKYYIFLCNFEINIFNNIVHMNENFFY